jgi:hypothetical protein
MKYGRHTIFCSRWAGVATLAGLAVGPSRLGRPAYCRGPGRLSRRRQSLAGRRAGPLGLLTQPRSGAPAKLRDDQKRLIPDFFWHGPEAYGFRGELWTCRRVAQILGEEFGAPWLLSAMLRKHDSICSSPSANFC